ncbi:MAG: hypothetical protein HN817_06310 [Porticoccaceae bacterium]|jgi:hypothetical protein|nr:hypothetical protein [Porticoccaceae bacterium]MBT7375524.1 hypothetical protein [Porticoccaceae bacterium]
MSLEQLTGFFGWCSVINIGVLLFSTIMLVLMKDWVINIHSKMFNLNPQVLAPIYFRYLGNLKLLVIVFNLVPYLALKLIS